MSRDQIAERRTLVQGLSTLYFEAGEGPVVLLLSGIAESARSWSRVMTELSQTHRALALVLPGLGGTSPTRDVRPPSMAAFAAAFLDSMGVTEAIVVGHSYGGAVAAELALARPELVTRLVLVDSAGLGKAINPLMAAASALPAWAADLAAQLCTLPGFGSLTDVSATLLMRQPWQMPVRIWRDQVRLVRARVPVRTTLEVLRQGTRLTGQKSELLVTDRLPEIEVPTLIVWGLTDMLLPVSQGARAARRLQHGRLEIIAGAGHVSFLDCHEDFMAALGPFVRDDLERLVRP